MLSQVTAFVPFWTAIWWYTPEARRKALPKFLVLWGMSLAPLLLAAGLQEVPADQNSVGAFCKKFYSSFFERHQFIYAVSFITPIFYYIWERHHDLLMYFVSRRRSIAGVKLTPPGFGVVLFWSAIFFLMTTVAYAAAETRSNRAMASTILESGSDIITILVYIFGLLCWYLMILDACATPTSDYYHEEERQKEEENEQQQAFSNRISASEDKP